MISVAPAPLSNHFNVDLSHILLRKTYRGSSASLAGPSFWNKYGRGGSPGGPMKKEMDLRHQQAQMALTRQRLLTLCFGEMETVRLLPSTYDELENVAREWTKPPPEAIFTLRVPVEFASLQASRLVTGPYVYLTGEDSFQIAVMGVQGLRVEIVSDTPPPPEKSPSPPPPPVLEMPGTFNLELIPGQQIALDTIIASEGDMDMARMEDGTMVDGQFWGKLSIIHQGDTHKLEFTGAKLPPNTDGGAYPTELIPNSRALTKLASVATRPVTAKCHLSILPPAQQYVDIYLSFSSYWKIGATWPPGESVPETDSKIKYFLRAYPGGALEHFESMMVTTSIYYEAIPDPSMIEATTFITPRNGFAMPTNDFLLHLTGVLDQLGMSMQARTAFITNNMSAFIAHKNIAYRFLSPRRIASAIDISVTAESCVFTRLFLIFRGTSEDDMQMFTTAGEKEANQKNWREEVGWTENSKDQTLFRVLETSVLEVL